MLEATKGTIFNIQNFSLHDGPGVRTILFFKGCPLRCQWCANPESQLLKCQIAYDQRKCAKCGHCAASCPAKALVQQPDGFIRIDHTACTLCEQCVSSCPNGALTIEGEVCTAGDAAKRCLKDKVFFEDSGGGVTLSGGEPLMQPEFARAVIDQLKESGVSVAIETTGFAPRETFLKVTEKADLLLFDVKHYDEQKHIEGTKVSNHIILGNLTQAIQNGKPVIARIPIIPGYNDSLDDMRGFIALFKKMGIDTVHILPFHQFGSNKYEFLGMDYAYKGVPQLHEEDLAEQLTLLLDNGFTAQIGG